MWGNHRYLPALTNNLICANVDVQAASFANGTLRSNSGRACYPATNHSLNNNIYSTTIRDVRTHLHIYYNHNTRAAMGHAGTQ